MRSVFNILSDKINILEWHFSVLLLSTLQYHIVLRAFLYFVFIVIFVTDVFERPSVGDSP